MRIGYTLMLFFLLILLLSGCNGGAKVYDYGDFDGDCEDPLPACDGDRISVCEDSERIWLDCAAVCAEDDLSYLGSCTFDSEVGYDVCWCG